MEAAEGSRAGSKPILPSLQPRIISRGWADGKGGIYPAGDVEPVCLIETLEEAAESVSRTDRPGIGLEPIAPMLMVPGSGSELTRLWTNLLENAVGHTPPEGSVTVSGMVDATSVTVTVADTGEGIAPEHLPHLGERFYRVDEARSAETGGNGLGLAICRSITAAHGGRMTIKSKVGEGTVVRIRLLRYLEVAMMGEA